MDDLTRRRKLPFIGVASIAAAVLLSRSFVTWAAEPAGEFPQIIPVTETFNDRPFDYRIESRTEKPRFTIYRLTYPSPVVTPLPQNNTVPAEYYLPNGIRAADPKRPAVICVHILEGDFVLVRMTCSLLASRGIPAIMFKLPYYGERGFREGPQALAANPELFIGALSQAFDDVRRTVDLLASRPEVDPQRIGITGISLGGIVAATAAGRDPRLSRAMLILAGGDLKRIIHHAWETRELSQVIRKLPPPRRQEIEQAIDAVDPLGHADRLRDRARRGRVLMVNAAEDEVIPRSCTEKLASALGIADQVTWLDGLGHYTALARLPQVLETMAEFFGQDLPPGLVVSVPAAARRTPPELLASLIQQAATVLVSEPEEGRCHFVDCHLSITPRGEQTMEARLRLIHGAQGRFRLDCDLPVVGRAAIGQGGYPWMVSGENVVFKGVGGPSGEAAHPLAFVERYHLTRLQMMSGAAAGIAIAPHVLSQWMTVTDAAPADGRRTLHVVLKGTPQSSLRLVLENDRPTPKQVSFDVAGAKGTVTFRAWETNTASHEAMFAPPDGLPERKVDSRDLHRIFSAMFNFAMESM